jgi:hypothetical protein
MSGGMCTRERCRGVWHGRATVCSPSSYSTLLCTYSGAIAGSAADTTRGGLSALYGHGITVPLGLAFGYILQVQAPDVLVLVHTCVLRFRLD